MACSSPISQDSCPKMSVYEKALLQLKYRGRADLILNQHCYRQEQPMESGEEEEEEDECEEDPLNGSADVPERIAGEDPQAGSQHKELAALDIASSFAEDSQGNGEGNATFGLLIDLEASPSAPPPKLNNTMTLDTNNIGLEGEGMRQQQQNTTFTLIDCPFEVSTSATAVEETANSNSVSEEEGQRPSRLPTLLKRTQPSLPGVVSIHPSCQY